MKTRHFLPILLSLVLAPTLSAWAKTISGTETQSGTQTLNESLTINGTYTINGDLTVKGNVTVNGKGTLIINGDLHVTGNFTGDYQSEWFTPKYFSNVVVNGNLVVDKKLTADGNITVNGDLTANSMDANHSITIGDNASITIDNKLTINTNTTVNGQLQAGSVECDSPLTVNNNATLTVRGKLTGNDDITVNGHLEAGEAKINENLTIGSDAMMVVNGDLTEDGSITVNGKLQANNVSVNNSLTVNDDAILYIKKDKSNASETGNLVIERGGTVTFNEGATAIIEGDLNQNDNTIISIFAGNNTGKAEADGSLVVIGGNYIIYNNSFGSYDKKCEFLDPDGNELYVGGNRCDLEDAGVSTTNLKRKDDIIKTFGSFDKLFNDLLPIELVYFKAHEFGGGVRFEWETASELNNDFFTIEFSIDAVEFAELTIIEGAGTSTEPQNYRYTDFSSHTGIIYYRLKQTDYDGNFSYSETVPVVFAEHHEARTEDIKFVVYPNPATDHITISGGEYESISFVSANGAVLGREAAQGSHDITRLPKGLNFVIIHTANGDASERFIKR